MFCDASESTAAFLVPAAENLPTPTTVSILKYPHPSLRAKNLLVKHFDDRLERIAKLMFDEMYRTEGIGLAAPQVGINLRLMVFNAAGQPCEVRISSIIIIIERRASNGTPVHAG